MKIGKLAEVAQCSVETVRYYEKEGLLPAPARTSGNFRQYGAEHVERLRFIRNCRALDMSHGEIRTLLRLADQPGDDCGSVNTLFDEHIAHVDERLRELAQLKLQLASLRARCQVVNEASHRVNGKTLCRPKPSGAGTKLYLASGGINWRKTLPQLIYAQVHGAWPP